MAGRGLQDIPLRVPDQWDPAWFTRFVREVLALADIRNAIEGTGVSIVGNSSQPATIAASADIAGLLNIPFVTLSLAAQLTAERVLTAGDGIALTDGGAGSTITISVNDVPFSVFGDLPALSLFGNQLPDPAAPAPIGGTQAGDVVWIRDVDGAGTLNIQFSNEPVWTGDHQWLDGFGVEFGDDIDLTISHDGTDGLVLNDTGELDVVNNDAGVNLEAATSVRASTDATLRIEIDVDGAWQLAGDAGDADQVLTSHGTGTPPTWEDASGGGGGGALVYVNTTIPAGNTVANTSSETAFTSSYDIPADSLSVGSIIRIALYGVYGTDSTPPTLRLRVKLDSTTIIDTTAITLTGSLTADGWCAYISAVVTAIGGSGTINPDASFQYGIAAADAQPTNVPGTVGTSVDTTVDQTVTVTVQWGAADTDNTITLRQVAIWLDAATAPMPAAAPATATFLTEADETASLPNSRQLLAGTNVTFDDTTPGERTISASGGGSANITPDTHPASPDAMDDEFEAGSLDAKWSWRNQGTSSVAFNKGSILLTPQLSTGSNTRCLEQPTPVGSWKVRAKVSGYWNTATAYGGLHVTESVSGKQLIFVFQSGDLSVLLMNSVTSFNSGLSSGGYVLSRDGGFEQLRYLEIEYDTTNIIFRVSTSGLDGTFRQVATTTPGAFLGAAPTNVGFHCSPDSTTVVSRLMLDWFRRVA